MTGYYLALPSLLLSLSLSLLPLSPRPPSQISYDKGEKYAAQVNALFCETSALNATNVEELFIQISKSFKCVFRSFSIGIIVV